MSSDRPKVYVAGPYSQGDSVLNVRNAILVGNALWNLGYAPFIPHTTMLWHLVVPRPYDDWMAIDRPWLLSCALYLWDEGRMPGKSKGALVEAIAARNAGIPVYWSLEDLTAEAPSPLLLTDPKLAPAILAEMETP